VHRRRSYLGWRLVALFAGRWSGGRGGPGGPQDADRTGALDASAHRVATAALVVGALALAAGLPAAPPEVALCPQPRELDARAGWTTAVVCGGRSETRGELRGPVKLLFGGALDLNRAEARGLEALPAIGPSRAAAIVRERDQRRFQSLGDLQRVPGIGPGIAADLRGWVKVSQPSEVAGDR